MNPLCIDFRSPNDCWTLNSWWEINGVDESLILRIDDDEAFNWRKIRILSVHAWTDIQSRVVSLFKLDIFYIKNGDWKHNLQRWRSENITHGLPPFKCTLNWSMIVKTEIFPIRILAFPYLYSLWILICTVCIPRWVYLFACICIFFNYYPEGRALNPNGELQSKQLRVMKMDAENTVKLAKNSPFEERFEWRI